MVNQPLQRTLIKKNHYFDSIFLMSLTGSLLNTPGITNAAVVMGTELNKEMLESAGFLDDEIRNSTKHDTIIAILAENPESIQTAENIVNQFIEQKIIDKGKQGYQIKTIRRASEVHPETNLVQISIPGQYATEQSLQALNANKHVFLFSDNVSLKDEKMLKQNACDKNLLLMGPGVGTSIINHTALGFANVLPVGRVGLISAAGTGLQEVSCSLAKHDIGISQAIGVGGRDLHKEIGGIMMMECLKAMQEDNQTDIIVLISKPPDPEIVATLLEQIQESMKQTVVCFLGYDNNAQTPRNNIFFTTSLNECTLVVLDLLNVGPMGKDKYLDNNLVKLSNLANKLKERINPQQKFLRGLFSGGTLCYETLLVWKRMLNAPVYSNTPLNGQHLLPNLNRSIGHSAIDLGEEEYTVGRPHPMIDYQLRINRMEKEAEEKDVLAILFDVVLGYGSHPDPASELCPVIELINARRNEEGCELIFIASVTGTKNDPQNLNYTTSELTKSGVIICESTASAAQLGVLLVKNVEI